MVVLHGGEVPDEIDDEKDIRNPESSNAPNVSYFENNNSKLKKYDELEEGAENQNDLSNNEQQEYSFAVSSRDIAINADVSSSAQSKTSANEAGYYHYALPPQREVRGMGNLHNIPEGLQSSSAISSGFDSSFQVDSESEIEEKGSLIKNL